MGCITLLVRNPLRATWSYLTREEAAPWDGLLLRLVAYGLDVLALALPDGSGLTVADDGLTATTEAAPAAPEHHGEQCTKRTDDHQDDADRVDVEAFGV